MSVNMNIRHRLPKGAVVLENYAYDNSIIGITLDNRVIYSFEKMVEELVEENDWSHDDAIEWIEYNTIRALPYLSDKPPIIVSENY